MSSTATAPLLISPQDLKSISEGKSDIVALDVSWFMPNSPRKPDEEFMQKRLPVNARRFDLDEVASSHPLGLKHMMPTASQFAGACAKLGISPSTHVVLYDTQGVFSSPRALFTFRAFGHQNSSVLDGGLPRWEAEGLPLITAQPSEPSSAADVTYPEPTLDQSVLRSYEQIVSNADLDLASSISAAELVLDARPAGRFTGQDPEPRPGLSSGHIPHSFSLPFTAFLVSNPSPGGSYTTFRSRDDVLAALSSSLGATHLQDILNGRRRVVASCGSGMTAGVLWLGLQLLGVRDTAIYDESWTGYAARPTSKIDKDS